LGRNRENGDVANEYKLINVRNGDEPVKVTPARFDITQPFKRYIHGIHEAISGYSYDIHQSTGVPMENK
jgi:rRNA maturation protein Nop10